MRLVLFMRVFSARARLAIAGVLMSAVAACGGVPDTLTSVSDTAPHEKVARAHRMPVQGIDVSRWQGDIDWRSVHRSGKRFAFIKATEGADHSDPRFRENWEAAKRAGVQRGAYHFMYWCSPAETQAKWFIENVPRDDSALPPVIDAEWNSHSRTCAARIDHDLARRKIAYMIDALEAHYGQRPIIYTDIPFHEDVLEGYLPQDDFWIRSTAAEPSERYRRDNYRFWQFTTTGRVPGIKGDVDRNSFMGGERAWADWLKRRAGARRPVGRAMASAAPIPAATAGFSSAVSALASPSESRVPDVAMGDMSGYPPAGNAGSQDDIGGLLRGEAVLF